MDEEGCVPSWIVLRPVRWSRQGQRLRGQDLLMNACHLLALVLAEPQQCKWRYILLIALYAAGTFVQSSAAQILSSVRL
jgi:hypothetical protein